MLSLHFLTCFKQELEGFIAKGIFKQALEKGLFRITFHDLRDFGFGKHNKIDDYPFSNKKGMILRADVVYNAVTSIEDYENMRIIYTCPKGVVLNQTLSTELYQCQKEIIIISGYYEGIDERIFELLPIEQISIGDYIINNGDSAAVVIAETLIRQQPGVLGNEACIADESHFTGLLGESHFTQPVTVNNIEAPAILRSGNHKAIQKYKEKTALKNTLVNRLDLLAKSKITSNQKQLITEILNEMVVKHNDK